MTRVRTTTATTLVLLALLGSCGSVNAVPLPHEDCRPGDDVDAFAINGHIGVNESEFGGAAELQKQYDDSELEDLLDGQSSAWVYVDNDNRVTVVKDGETHRRQLQPEDQVDGVFCDVYDGIVDGENSIKTPTATTTATETPTGTVTTISTPTQTTTDRQSKAGRTADGSHEVRTTTAVVSGDTSSEQLQTVALPVVIVISAVGAVLIGVWSIIIRGNNQSPGEP